MWKKIWSLKLPGKIKIFLWRLLHNSLPTRRNIKRKHVELDTVYPMCYRADEDGGHLFLKCKKVKQVWRGLLMEDIRLSLVEAPNPLVMMESIPALSREKLYLSCILMWDWWTSRNKVNAGEMARPEGVICSSIQKHMIEFPAPCVIVSAESEESGPSLIKETLAWERPNLDQVKVNVDAAF
jgi:hypothetical protein